MERRDAGDLGVFLVSGERGLDRRKARALLLEAGDRAEASSRPPSETAEGLPSPKGRLHVLSKRFGIGETQGKILAAVVEEGSRLLALALQFPLRLEGKGAIG